MGHPLIVRCQKLNTASQSDKNLEYPCSASQRLRIPDIVSGRVTRRPVHMSRIADSRLYLVDDHSPDKTVVQMQQW